MKPNQTSGPTNSRVAERGKTARKRKRGAMSRKNTLQSSPHICGRLKGHKGRHKCTRDFDNTEGKGPDRQCGETWARKGGDPMTNSGRKPEEKTVNDELIVKDIKADGTVICGSPEETKAFDEKTKTIFRNVTACHHCDKKFPESYIRWHAARAHKREDRMAVLTCKKCFCWTPVQFNFNKEADPA